MANDFIISFQMDWSNAERSTSQFFQQVRSELKKLDAEKKRLEKSGPGGSEPKAGTPAGNRLKELRDPYGDRAILDSVSERRKRLDASTKRNQAELANANAAAKEAVAYQTRIATEKALTNKRLAANDAAGKAYQEATLEAAVNQRALAAKIKLQEQQAFLTRGQDGRTREGKILNNEATVGINNDLLQAGAQVRKNARITADVPGGLQGYAKAIAAGTVAQETLKATVEAAENTLRAGSREYRDAQAAAAVALRERKAAETKATQAAILNNPTLIASEAANNVTRNTIASKRAIIEAELLAGSEIDLKIMAQRIVAEREVQKALNQRVGAELAARRAAGLDASGTRFQQLQSNLAARRGGSPRAPTDFSTLGQFVGSKALTTAGFALSGTVLFGIVAGLGHAYTEATKLQSQFAILQEQLAQTDRAGEFRTLRDGILGIARDTGIAASELTTLAIQLRGAFSDKGADFINAQVDAAAKFEKITGLSTAETTDSFTAISRSFGVNFKQIADTSVGLQQRFGVLSKEIVTFSADLAPVAAQAGITFEKLAGIGAAVQQVSGRSGAGLAESLGRVFSGLQDNAASILSIYQNNSKLAGQTQTIAQQLATGQTGKVLENLIQNYDKLTKAQQNLLNSALGGSRQAPVLAGLFGGKSGLKAELDRINAGGSDAGKLQSQFTKLQGTLAQGLAQFKQSALQVGVALSQSVLPVLEDLVSVLSALTNFIGPIVGFFADLNDATGGLGTKLLEIYLALKAISTLRQLSLFSGGAKGIAAAAAPAASGLLGANGLPLASSAAAPGIFGASKAGFAAGGLASGAKAGLAAALPSTVAGGLALGATASAVLVTALASGFENGVAQRISKAQQDAPKQSLTEKGLRLAEKGTGPTFTTEIHGLGEAAHNVKNAFTGQASEQELIQDEYQKAVGAAYVAQIKAVTNLKGLKNPRELIKRAIGQGGLIQSKEGFTNKNLNAADPTDDTTFEELKRIHDQLVKKYGKDYIDNILKAFKRQNQTKVTNAALKAGDLQSTEQFLSQKRANYEAGQTTGAQYLQSLQRVISANKLLVQTGSASSDIVNQYLNTTAEYSKFVSDQIKAALDRESQIRQYTGTDSAEQNIQALLDTLQNSQFTDKGDRADVLGQIYQEYNKVLQAKIDLAQTAAEKLAIAKEGIPLDINTRIETVKAQVDSLVQQNIQAILINKAAILSGGSLDSVEQEVSAFALWLGITIEEALAAWLAKQAQEAIELYNGMTLAASYATNLTATAKAAIANQKALIGSLFDAIVQFKTAPGTQPNAPGAVVGSGDQIAQLTNSAADEAASAAENIAAAQANLLKAMAGNDPILQAQAEIAAANAEFANAKTEADRLNAQAHQIQAQHQFQDAVNAIASAQANLLAAWVEKNPLLSAQLQLTQADQALQAAEGEAARLQAEADRVRAQHAIQQAIFDITNSQTELLIAIATGAGNTVDAARLALKESLDKLAQARQLNAGPAELNGLQTQIVQQQAALRDASLQEKESIIDFNLQTEKISTAQAVAQYQALLNNATVLGLTEQQTRDLILKIQGLKKSLSQDLQFDLPTDLRLPTLYEARRLSQSGGSYQDNRTVTITLYSTDPQSTEAAVTQIQDALNAPSLFGSGPRIY